MWKRSSISLSFIIGLVLLISPSVTALNSCFEGCHDDLYTPLEVQVGKSTGDAPSTQYVKSIHDITSEIILFMDDDITYSLRYGDVGEQLKAENDLYLVKRDTESFNILTEKIIEEDVPIKKELKEHGVMEWFDHSGAFQNPIFIDSSRIMYQPFSKPELSLIDLDTLEVIWKLEFEDTFYLVSTNNILKKSTGFHR